jgi:hypothetical protein
MALPEPKGHRIPLSEAVAQTKRFRENLHNGGLFLRQEIDELLAQPGCAGLRFYYGRSAEGANTLILIGADTKGDDMTDVVLDVHFPCPPYCNDVSPLNS